MENLLKQTAELFSLEENRKFNKAVKIILEKNAKEKKKEKARETIYIIVIDACYGNEKVASNLTKTEKEERAKIENEYADSNEMSEEFLKKALKTFNKHATVCYDMYYINIILSEFKEINKNIKSIEITDELKKVKKNTSIADKKAIIKTILGILKNNIEATLATKYATTSPSKKMQSSINRLNTLYASCIKKIDNKNSSGLDISDIVMQYLDQMDKVLGKTKSTSNAPKPALKKTPKSGKTDKPIKANGKKYKVMLKVIGGSLVLIVMVGGLLWAISKDKTEKVPEQPGLEDQTDENQIIIDGNKLSEAEKEVYILEQANKIYSNWSKIGCDYTVSDIVELIKYFSGLESTMSPGVVDNIIIEMINNATIPAVNNAIIGEVVAPTEGIHISDLVVTKQTGLESIKNMESYLNGAITDPANISNYEVPALEDEVLLAVCGETVDGMNVTDPNNTVAPELRQLWARTAIGANAIFGVYDTNPSIIVDGEAYMKEEIINCELFDQIVETAKTDIGENGKRLTK